MTYLKSADFIPDTRCHYCERACDEGWEAVWFDDGPDLALHPVCETCVKERDL